MGNYRLGAISAGRYAEWYGGLAVDTTSRSPFHHPAWLSVAGQGSGCTTVYIGIYSGAELVAVLPAFLTRRGPLRLFGSPLRGTMTSYLGPIGWLPDGPERAILLDDCARYARRTWHAHYIEYILAASPGDEGTDRGPGWEVARRGSYQLDLRRGEAALWAEIKGRARRNIRKAERLGVRIVPLQDPGAFHRMQSDTFARRGTVPTFSLGFHRLILERLAPLGLIEAWGAEYEGQLIAGGIFLGDDREVHYLSGASLSQYRAIPTSYLLHWHVIMRAARAGRSCYDFTGRGIAGIDQFKEGFSPTSIDYWTANWATAPVRLAQRGFLAALPRFRRLQRHLGGGPKPTTAEATSMAQE